MLLAVEYEPTTLAYAPPVPSWRRHWGKLAVAALVVTAAASSIIVWPRVERRIELINAERTLLQGPLLMNAQGLQWHLEVDLQDDIVGDYMYGGVSSLDITRVQAAAGVTAGQGQLVYAGPMRAGVTGDQRIVLVSGLPSRGAGLRFIWTVIEPGGLASSPAVTRSGVTTMAELPVSGTVKLDFLNAELDETTPSVAYLVATLEEVATSSSAATRPAIQKLILPLTLRKDDSLHIGRPEMLPPEEARLRDF